MVRIFRPALAGLLVLFCCATARAQGVTNSSLSGVVGDAAGGVLPGATVVVKNTATGVAFDAVTNSAGTFSLPALNPGTYTVTVSLQGFKTAVITDVKLLPATPHDIKVTLEIGSLEETVTVIGASELIQTRSATVSSTVNVDQINSLPLPTRNAMNFITYLAGVNTTGINRDSVFNGLPRSAVAISLDGVNNNENYNKSTEGLFAMVTPRQDAVEAVTVTTAVPGAEAGGHGAVSIQFVTRSGTDRFSGSAYEYMRRPGFNTNYYFNELRGLPKNQVKIDQYGFRQGGPIVIPKVYDGRGKAFFFFNYEEFRMPNSFSRNRTIMTPEAQNGIFRYGTNPPATCSAPTAGCVPLYVLAQQNGQLATPDPTTASVLAKIRTLTASEGTITATSDPNTLAYNFLSGGNQVEKQPTMRVDVNVSNKHRVTGTYTHQILDRDPDHLNSVDVRFPGALNYRRYLSYRNLASGALRSVFSGTVVNELRGGLKWGPSYFGRPEWNGPESFSDQGGRALVLGNIGQTLTNLYTNFTPSARSAWSWNIDETVNWQKGNHGLKFGGSFFDGHFWVQNQTMVPQITFGVDTSDPANAMFNTTNFPGASSTQLTSAKNLYALLTGRVISITADARLDEATGKYVALGPRTMRLRQKEWGLFVQDMWRVNTRLSIGAGLRWDLQQPIEAANDILSMSTLADLCGVSGTGSYAGCNMFQPGASGGKRPTYVPYDQGSPGYKTDWNNVAPSIGFSWQPAVQGGVGRAILGDPDQATLRAGFSIAYNREGMALFQGVYNDAQGSTIDVNRSAALSGANAIVRPGETWPALLRDESRMGLPPFAESPVYPITANYANSVSVFDPNIQVASARSLTLSLQRALTRDMAFEVRYNGTWGRNLWLQENLDTTNNINIVENKFLDEFRVAQANLRANIAAGRGATFAYTGAAGTAPLPAIFAYAQGLPAAQNSDPTKYTSTVFTDSSFLNTLATYNPLPCCTTSSFAYLLYNNATRRQNALNGGLPANFFVVNPDVSGALIYRSNGASNYNALQLELRQRMSHGLQFTANYQYARSQNQRSIGVRYPMVSQLNLAGVGGQPVVPPHAFKLTWNYSLPFGRGRKFGTDMSKLADSLIGGWEFNGAGRVQARWLDFGNVRLVNMTEDDLRAAYKIRIAPDPVTGVQTVYALPQDIIDNSIKAFSTSPTSSTGYSSLGPPEGRYMAPANGPTCIQVKPGDCAALNHYVRSPLFTRFDVSFAKRFPIKGRTSFEVRFDIMNVFDNINFLAPDTFVGSTQTMGQVTTAYTDMSNTFDPGGRLGQLVFRFNW